MNNQRFPEPRLLLGPGPSPVHPRVLAALGRPPIGYLDPELFTILDEIADGLRFLFRTKNAYTIPLTGTGMSGMEFCLANLLEPGETIVVAVNGFFGGRMGEIAERVGASVVRVDHDWGMPIDAARVADACDSLDKPPALVGCVHAETSTGVESDCAAVAKIAHERHALFVMDAVTSLGGIPVEVDDWNVDACYSATQKCVGAPPGLSPVTLSSAAWEKIEKRKSLVPNWYLDAKKLDAYYHARPAAYHHTVPVNLLFALRESLSLIREEGLEARWQRHTDNAALLWQRLGALEAGFSPFAPAENRLPTLNSVRLPDDLHATEADVRRRLLAEYGIEVGGGFGALAGKLWRVGLMGHGSQARNVFALTGALETLLSKG